MIKQIKIIEGESYSDVQNDVNEYLIELYKEASEPDDIEILCNITKFGNGKTYYTYTIIYLEQD